MSHSIRAALVALSLVIAGCGGSGSDGGGAGLSPVPLGDEVYPDDVAAAPNGALWTVVGKDIARVDAGGDKFAAAPQPLIPGSDLATIYDVSAGDAGVWAIGTGTKDKTFLFPADERTGRAGERVESKVYGEYLDEGEGLDVASGAGRVWGAREGGFEVVMLDPAAGTQKRIATGTGEVADVAAGGGYGWTITGEPEEDALAGTGALVRIDPGGKLTDFELDAEPTSVAFGAGSVWILFDGSIERRGVDGRVQAEIDLSDVALDGGVGEIAAGGDAVWATSYSDNQLVRIDTEANKIAGDPLAVEEPRDLAVTSDGAAWVTRNYEPVLRASR